MIQWVLFFQSELPQAQNRPWEQFGAYSIWDFLGDNWFFIVAIILMVLAFWNYRHRLKKRRQKEKQRWQN